MTKTLTLLLAATALSTAVAIPAWSAMRTTMPEMASQLILVDDDEGDGDQDHAVKAGKRDQDEDDEDDDDDCEDDDGACGGAMNSAPAGKTLPPANGLFGKGELPKAQVN